jgi:hypothetical protein
MGHTKLGIDVDDFLAQANPEPDAGTEALAAIHCGRNLTYG